MAMGDESEDFLSEAAKVAEHCRRGVGDLTHWSAMIWGGGHWRLCTKMIWIYQGAAREFGAVASGSSPQPHFRLSSTIPLEG